MVGKGMEKTLQIFYKHSDSMVTYYDEKKHRFTNESKNLRPFNEEEIVSSCYLESCEHASKPCTRFGAGLWAQNLSPCIVGQYIFSITATSNI